jgi:hypothetical protein
VAFQTACASFREADHTTPLVLQSIGEPEKFVQSRATLLILEANRTPFGEISNSK